MFFKHIQTELEEMDEDKKEEVSWCVGCQNNTICNPIEDKDKEEASEAQ